MIGNAISVTKPGCSWATEGWLSRKTHSDTRSFAAIPLVPYWAELGENSALSRATKPYSCDR